MQLEIEVWERQTTRCPDCRGQRVVYSGEAVADGATLAVFGAFLYDHHPGNPEVFIDATFGTWGDEEYAKDHETFGSRTGAVDDPPRISSSLVTGAEAGPDHPHFGVKLTREQALEHPRLETFREVQDAVLELDEIRRLLSGQPRRRRWPRRR